MAIIKGSIYPSDNQVTSPRRHNSYGITLCAHRNSVQTGNRFLKLPITPKITFCFMLLGGVGIEIPNFNFEFGKRFLALARFGSSLHNR